MKQKYPPPFKGAKPKQTRGRGKPKGHRQTHQKTKKQMNHVLMITLIIITIMIITLPEVRVEATDLLMVKAVANNLEASHSDAEARDLSIIHINFRTTGLREVHSRATAINTVATTNLLPG